MKLITAFVLVVALGGVTLAAAPAAPVHRPDPTVAGRASMEDCSPKGCPQLDQNGQPPVSCEYKSGMATGWQCILICTYPKSSWGTLSDASNCN